MLFWVGVENFAKIESAKICIDNYTLLVGPNNSGKTFLMQLVQGVSEKLIDLLEEDVVDVFLDEKVEGYSRYSVNDKNIGRFVEYINDKLKLKKEQLVKEIFGREIPVEKLYIEIKAEDDDSYHIDIIDSEIISNEEIKNAINPEVFTYNVLKWLDNKKWKKLNLVSRQRNAEEPELFSVGLSVMQTEFNLLKNALKNVFDKNTLFLPASRTGLMLLYRDFFANKTDNTILYQREEDELIENREQHGSLTQPLYEFLRFLQTYSEDEQIRRLYAKELSFFEDKLIDGHINVNKQGDFSYSSKSDNNVVPMYLASAMINEVTPIVLALTSRARYKRIIIDEVEASLHPQKQLELVRFLNRINNKGIKLIFSTHSDTFVSKLNNLYVLSEYVRGKQDNSIIEQFGFEKEDLIQASKLFVYEFIIQENGRSVVKEIIPSKETGYQFDLFTKSAMSLYDEALRLGEIQ